VEVELVNPIQLIRYPRMINVCICSCLSKRDEIPGSTLVWRNCIPIIGVEKGGDSLCQSWQPFFPGLFLDDNYFATLITCKNDTDRFCGLVVGAPGYRSGGPGAIPGGTRSSVTYWVWNGVRSAS
jgi:hypothetical protein